MRTQETHAVVEPADVTTKPKRSRKWLWIIGTPMVLFVGFVVFANLFLAEQVSSSVPSEHDLPIFGLATPTSPTDLVVEVSFGGPGCLTEIRDPQVHENDEQVRVEATAHVHDWCSYQGTYTFELAEPLGDRVVVNSDGTPLEYNEQNSVLG